MPVPLSDFIAELSEAAAYDGTERAPVRQNNAMVAGKIPTGGGIDLTTLPSVGPIMGDELFLFGQGGNKAGGLSDLAPAVLSAGAGHGSSLPSPTGRKGQHFFTNAGALYYAISDSQWVRVPCGRSLPNASSTATGGNGTATGSTGTLTLPNGAVTSSQADTPSFATAHGGNIFKLEVTIDLLAFTGGDGHAQAVFCIQNAGNLSGWTVRVYGDGQWDILDTAGSSILTHYFAGGLALDGLDCFRWVFSLGSYYAYFGRHAAPGDAPVWTLKATGNAYAPGAASTAQPTVVLRLDAQSGATAGTRTVQWGDPVVRDL